MILAIEFDCERFSKTEDCENWLKASSFDSLLQVKGFRLRHRKRPNFLTYEPRSIFSYYANLWKYKSYELERPEPYVVVVRRTGSEQFPIVDIPPLLPQTKVKAEKIATSLKKRKEKQMAAREKRKNFPKKPSKKQRRADIAAAAAESFDSMNTENMTLNLDAASSNGEINFDQINAC